jgi:WXG100 family type VII secretion target
VNAEYHVDLDQLEEIVAGLRGFGGFVSERLAELDRQVAALHSGDSWTGVAAHAHEQAHRKWSAAAKEFNQGVSDMQTAATRAHGHYTTATATNSSMLKPR